jgi:malate dehydrogenase (oxaloacetate-decarboxylating)
MDKNHGKRRLIVFACANPIPEIWPWDAEEAGARIVATGEATSPTKSTTA